MSQIRLQTYILHIPKSSFILVLTLFSGNLLFNVIANSSFKVSATSTTWQSFLAWQVLGNLAGLNTVVTLTGLLHYFPLHVVFPLTAGAAVIGVQVVAARLLFNEMITPAQWLGTFLVVGGVFALLPSDGSAAGYHLMSRLGFTIFPYHCLLGSFGEFWENFYSWLLLWTYNPASLSSHRMLKLHRKEIWMLKDEFTNRYGLSQSMLD